MFESSKVGTIWDFDLAGVGPALPILPIDTLLYMINSPIKVYNPRHRKRNKSTAPQSASMI